MSAENPSGRRPGFASRLASAVSPDPRARATTGDTLEGLASQALANNLAGNEQTIGSRTIYGHASVYSNLEQGAFDSSAVPSWRDTPVGPQHGTPVAPRRPSLRSAGDLAFDDGPQSPQRDLPRFSLSALDPRAAPQRAPTPQQLYDAIRQGAAAGDPESIALLGGYFETGMHGHIVDEAIAMDLYRRAALDGNAIGQFGLACFLEEGRGGLARDAAEATRFYALAAAQGHVRAAGKLHRNNLARASQHRRRWP
jgi:TPR repeat protein